MKKWILFATLALSATGAAHAYGEDEKVRQRIVEREAREAQERLAREKIAALEACKANPKYQFFKAEQDVLWSVEFLRNNQDDITKEHRISHTSGVRDLYQERMNGSLKVQLQDELKANWATYKKLGGKARSPQAVKRTLNDPCEELRPATPQ